MTGDQKLQAEGAADKAKGAAKSAVGGVTCPPSGSPLLRQRTTLNSNGSANRLCRSTAHNRLTRALLLVLVMYAIEAAGVEFTNGDQLG